MASAYQRKYHIAREIYARKQSEWRKRKRKAKSISSRINNISKIKHKHGVIKQRANNRREIKKKRNSESSSIKKAASDYNEAYRESMKEKASWKRKRHINIESWNEIISYHIWHQRKAEKKEKAKAIINGISGISVIARKKAERIKHQW